jgi:TetR/AcrR family transcriptional repressor of nem operon
VTIPYCISYTDRYICIVEFVVRSEATRKRIIEETAGLFNKQGYAGTSLSDLEKATKLTKGSIYGNFQNKEQVAIAAFDYNLQLIRDAIQQKVDAAGNYYEKLIAHIQVYQNADKSFFPEGGCPMQNTATEADDTNEELRKRAEGGLIMWKDDMVKLIEEGVAAKEFKLGTDAEQVALNIIALVEGAILIARATKQIKYAVTIFDLAKEVINKIRI